MMMTIIISVVISVQAPLLILFSASPPFYPSSKLDLRIVFAPLIWQMPFHRQFLLLLWSFHCLQLDKVWWGLVRYPNCHKCHFLSGLGNLTSIYPTVEIYLPDVLDSLLNKKSKRIELTLTSSVSRALSYRILLFCFMRYASFPRTRCWISLTSADPMATKMSMNS